MSSMKITPPTVYHQVAVMPRASWRAPGPGSERAGEGLLTLPTIEA